MGERRVVQGAIESVILLAGRHAEPLAHQVKEPACEVGARRELSLCQPVASARGA